MANFMLYKVYWLYDRHRSDGLSAIAVCGLVVGAGLWWFGYSGRAEIAWSIATAPALVGLIVQIATSLREGNVGLDVVAALSMSAALVFGEPLAGNVVALMYSGGQLLELFAQGRAKREMTALLGRVAHTAMRLRDANLEEVPIASFNRATAFSSDKERCCQ